MLFTIIFINWNCVFMVNVLSHYNFIDHCMFILSLCVVLIGLVLLYFIQSDKIIDIIYIECPNYCFNEESAGQSLQVNIILVIALSIIVLFVGTIAYSLY